jgi:hypothetical protein
MSIPRMVCPLKSTVNGVEPAGAGGGVPFASFATETFPALVVNETVVSDRVLAAGGAEVVVAGATVVVELIVVGLSVVGAVETEVVTAVEVDPDEQPARRTPETKREYDRKRHEEEG